jgi:chromosome segregation ATPase
MAAMSEVERLQARLQETINKRNNLTLNIPILEQEIEQYKIDAEQIKEHVKYNNIRENDGTGEYEDFKQAFDELQAKIGDNNYSLSMTRGVINHNNREIAAIQNRLDQIARDAADREARRQAALEEERQRMIAYHSKACADAEARLNNPDCVIMKRGGFVQPKRTRRIGTMK